MIAWMHGCILRRFRGDILLVPRFEWESGHSLLYFLFNSSFLAAISMVPTGDMLLYVQQGE